jgi:hypothetical protein
MYPSNQIRDLLVAQIGKLGHWGELCGLGDSGAQKGPNYVTVVIPAD